MKTMARKMTKRLPTLLAACSLLAPSLGYAQRVEYYHLDALGSVRAVTDENREVIERHDYLPFGEEWNPEPGSQPRKFTGKERDEETGLDYFGARYYEASLARFTSIDPVTSWGANRVDPQRWNRYAYVRNNPLRLIDPNGEDVGEAAAWVQGKVSFAADFYISAAVDTGTPAIAAPATFVASFLELGINGIADAFRVGESTGAALGRGDTGLAFAAAVAEDAGRAGSLILLGLAVSPRPTPAGSQYFKPGAFAGEGVPLRGPGRLSAAERAQVNVEGNSLGCHTCGRTTPGTRSGNWVGDHQPVSALNKSTAPQRGFPHCMTCSATQGGYASQAVRSPQPVRPILAVPQRRDE